MDLWKWRSSRDLKTWKYYKTTTIKHAYCYIIIDVEFISPGWCHLHGIKIIHHPVMSKVIEILGKWCRMSHGNFRGRKKTRGTEWTFGAEKDNWRTKNWQNPANLQIKTGKIYNYKDAAASSKQKPGWGCMISPTLGKTPFSRVEPQTRTNTQL